MGATGLHLEMAFVQAAHSIVTMQRILSTRTGVLSATRLSTVPLGKSGESGASRPAGIFPDITVRAQPAPWHNPTALPEVLQRGTQVRRSQYHSGPHGGRPSCGAFCLVGQQEGRLRAPAGRPGQLVVRVAAEAFQAAHKAGRALHVHAGGAAMPDLGPGQPELGFVSLLPQLPGSVPQAARGSLHTQSESQPARGSVCHMP